MRKAAAKEPAGIGAGFRQNLERTLTRSSRPAAVFPERTASMKPRSSPPFSVWLKSSYSGPNGGDCIEYTPGPAGTIAVRDSKNPDGPVLALTPAAFAGLVSYAKSIRI
jgi:hypothetical protein